MKCYNCEKEFDYSKYYGICPKCSAYNKENQAEEVHEELHNEYDETDSHENIMSSFQNVDTDEYKTTAYTGTEKQRRTSSASIAGFVCILAGLIVAIGAPIGYIRGQVADVAGMEAIDSFKEFKENDNIDSYDSGINRIPQTPEIISVNVNEAFALGEKQPCTVSVEEAYIVTPADSVPGFPVSENLVAIKVNYQNGFMDTYEYYDYPVSDRAYVGYAEQFKGCLEEYELETYKDYLPEINILDMWKMTDDINGNGVFLAFVPVGVTEINFYMDSRTETTNGIKEIYSVPLSIGTGEEL